MRRHFADGGRVLATTCVFRLRPSGSSRREAALAVRSIPGAMKYLRGYQTPDAGRLTVHGQSCSANRTGSASTASARTSTNGVRIGTPPTITRSHRCRTPPDLPPACGAHRAVAPGVTPSPSVAAHSGAGSIRRSATPITDSESCDRKRESPWVACPQVRARSNMTVCAPRLGVAVRLAAVHTRDWGETCPESAVSHHSDCRCAGAGSFEPSRSSISMSRRTMMSAGRSRRYLCQARYSTGTSEGKVIYGRSSLHCTPWTGTRTVQDETAVRSHLRHASAWPRGPF